MTTVVRQIVPIEAVPFPEFTSNAYLLTIDGSTHVANYVVGGYVSTLLRVTHLFETDRKGQDPKAINDQQLIDEVAIVLSIALSTDAEPIRADVS